jgi:hypothetical protein
MFRYLYWSGMYILRASGTVMPDKKNELLIVFSAFVHVTDTLPNKSVGLHLFQLLIWFLTSAEEPDPEVFGPLRYVSGYGLKLRLNKIRLRKIL